MRVLVNASRDTVHPHAGGSEVYIDHVLSGLHARGHQVHLSVGGPAGDHPYPTSSAGGTFGQFLTAPFRALRRSQRADVVVDVANGMTFYSPLYRLAPTVCLVHHVHTSMWSQWFSPPVAAFGRFLERRVMPLAYRRSLFVTVSDSTKRELVALGVDPDRIRLAANATLVPDQPVAPKADTPLIVAVGRLVPHKRFDLLLRHWSEIRRATGARLVVIGEGPERGRLEALQSEGVELVGAVSDAERDRLLAAAWLLVHPASVEGWGLVVMEAAAQGTPSVGVDVPGVRDSVVDGLTGWLASGPDRLAATVIRAMSDREELARRSGAARRRARNFGVSQTVDAFEAALIEAATERQPALTASTVGI